MGHKASCGLAAALLLVCAAAPANAQAARTWVSGLGDDQLNPCSRTAPCKSLAGAISKTAVGGEISVLDPGGYGGVTITKSITINGTPGAGYGSILAKDIHGVIINIPKDDPYKTVRLNWLDINGASSGVHGIRIVDGQAAGVSVVIENTNIDGFTGSGILDERSVGGKLTVADTVVRHTQQSGIKIAAGGLGNRIQATLSNVRVHNSAQAGLTVNGGAKATVRNSVFSGSAYGLDVEQANSELSVDGSTISHNGTAFFTTGGAALRLSNSNVAFNDAGANGVVESFTNNRFVANGAGTPVTPIGQPSSPTGQQ
jgi:hypothetical protein